MKRLFSITASLFLISFVSTSSGQRQNPTRAHVVILSTTDMHGRIFPIDYYTNKYDNVGITNWENPPNYAGLEFHENLSEAKKWVPILRGKEKVDVVVIAMHMGIEEDLRTGQINPSQVPNENAAIAIARQVPGVDVILMGHTHREVSDLFVNGVLLTQANRWASHVARVDLYLEKSAVDNRWHAMAKSARTIPVTEKTAIDPEIAQLGQSYDKE